MIAFVLGDEKSPKPVPSIRRIITRYHRGVLSVRKIRRKSPKEVIAIPADATMRGSILSESRPAIGEIIAWTTGCATRIIPACSGVKPFVYWRSRLKRKVTAKVAL
jgi:hypothetical protein